MVTECLPRGMDLFSKNDMEVSINAFCWQFLPLMPFLGRYASS